MISPSGLVRVAVAERFGARWAIYVRDEMLASGRNWRGLRQLQDAAEAVAAKCDETPGLGEAGAELRVLMNPEEEMSNG